MLNKRFRKEAGTKPTSKLKAVPILRWSKIGTAFFYVYFIAVVLRYGGRFPGGTGRACSLSHALVPWESPPSLRTTNISSISIKFLHRFKHKKRTSSDKIKLPHKTQTERSVLMFKDYNMNQLVLPLDLEVKLQKNDIAFPYPSFS